MPVAAGKVTVGMASHWPDFSSLHTYRLRKGDEHPAYTSQGVWHTLPCRCMSLQVICDCPSVQTKVVVDAQRHVQCDSFLTSIVLISTTSAV